MEPGVRTRRHRAPTQATNRTTAAAPGYCLAVSGRAASHVVHGKVLRVSPRAEHIVRDRLSRRLGGDARVTLVAAMPGSGKSIAVAQWADTLDVPVAWLSLDLLDGDARSFWSHLLLAVATALPDLDTEAQMLLEERGVDDPLFLIALVAAILALGRPVVLVLDGLDERVERSAQAGLALLIERTDGLVRAVITSRTAPGLPLANWRGRGWLAEIRQEDLRLTDEEAIAVAERIDPRAVAHAAAVNRRVDGWLIAFHMALLTGADPDRPALGVLADESTRGLASSLVAEVLESMTDQEQATALALSVFESFDPDICHEVVGPDAAGVVRDLLRRGMFLTIVDASAGRMRFHALFRELLEGELAWRDPAARIDLHRRAATVWQTRGDLLSAYHHLAAIGELDSASRLLLEPVLAMVDRGDLASLHRLARQLPAPQDVVSVTLALDLGVVATYAQGTVEARRWTERTHLLMREYGGLDEEGQLRLLALECWIDLLGADLDGAVARVRSHVRAGGTGAERQALARLPLTAARALLASRHRDEALWWLERAELLDGPEIVVRVTVPTLRAWYEWVYGRLDRAIALIDPALSWIDQRTVRAHHLAFDTLITAGWCRLSAGDLAGAAEHDRGPRLRRHSRRGQRPTPTCSVRTGPASRPGSSARGSHCCPADRTSRSRSSTILRPRSTSPPATGTPTGCSVSRWRPWPVPAACPKPCACCAAWSRGRGCSCCGPDSG